MPLQPHEKSKGIVFFVGLCFLEKVQGATRLGATRLRASEREICLWEGLWEDFWKPLKKLWKPLKSSKNLWKPLKLLKNYNNLWKNSENLPLRDPLREPLRGRFALGPVAPIVLPLNLSPSFPNAHELWLQVHGSFLKELFTRASYKCNCISTREGGNLLAQAGFGYPIALYPIASSNCIRSFMCRTPIALYPPNLDGQNRQSPIASVQRTRSTLASHSAVARGTNVKRMNANRAIPIAAQRMQGVWGLISVFRGGDMTANAR